MLYAMATQPYPVLDSSLVRVKAVGTTLVFVGGPKDGLVASVQPDGALDTRPAGTSGGYEKCVVSGGFAGYDPSPASSGPFLFTLTPIPG